MLRLDYITRLDYTVYRPTYRTMAYIMADEIKLTNNAGKNRI